MARHLPAKKRPNAPSSRSTTWAQAGTLLDYDSKESSQAWYQVEWTLSAIAIDESVLVNEPSLDPAPYKISSNATSSG